MTDLNNQNAAEVVQRGQELYEQQIQLQVEAAHWGKFLVLDIKTGLYEIDAEDLAASKRLLARVPNAVLYGVRVGSPTAYRLGRSTQNGAKQ